MATDKSAASTVTAGDFLIRGSEYLAQHPGFKLAGRQAELTAVSDVLMRKDNNNLLLYGQNGVGLTSIILGLQASKDDLNTPFDIVGKRFYYLDADALFSSGDTAKINAGFQAAMATLTRAPDTVLVIEDTKDFLDGIRNYGMSNLMNQLMRETRKNSRFQVIFEARDETLPDLFKSHSDIAEIFTPIEVREPNKEELRGILQGAVEGLEEFHGVHIAAEAIDSVVELTMKYPGMTLGAAQPKRSAIVLEGALTAYRRKAHASPMELEKLEEELQAVTAALQSGKPGGALAGKSPQELETIQLETTQEIAAVKANWDVLQKKIRSAYADQRTGEENIFSLDEQIAELAAKESFAKEKREECKAAPDEETKARALKEYFDRYGETLNIADEKKASTGFAAKLGKAGFETVEMRTLKDERDKWSKLVTDNAVQYKELTRSLNQGLVLTESHILAEFSRLSGLSLSKLNEDATAKLANIDAEVKKRVFGQDQVVTAVTDYIKFGTLGLKDENKPIGNFLFIGPTGTGKTELVKALAEQLFGDERAMTRFDMGGFQEKNTVSTLVGAPRGYEGYAEGGLLTNAVRKKPNSVVLYDEVEKAHKDVFDLLLPVFDEGVLADTRGMVATFGGVLNVMTSNIGAKHFMNPDLTYEQAKELAMKDLHNQNKDEGGSGFRPEFLARLDGIYYFKSLEVPQIILIAVKELKKLAKYLEKKEIVPVMAPADIAAMCEDHNDKAIGGRGIRRYINNTIKAETASIMLENRAQPGTVTITYNKAAKKAEMAFTPAAVKDKASVIMTQPAFKNG